MQRVTEPSGVVRGALAVSLALALWAQAQVCSAQSSAPDGLTTSFTINDADPESSVPAPEAAMKRPLDMGYHIMMLSERGEKAYAGGDYAAAIRYYRALQKAVPDMSLPRRKLCVAHEAAGETTKALEACRAALGLNGTNVEDSERYVKLVLAQVGALSARDVADVDSISTHLEEQLGAEQGPTVAKKMQCQLAVRMNDIARLEACTTELNKLRPNDPETLVFAWTLSLMKGDLAQAEQWIARARDAQLPPRAVTKLETALQLERDKRAPWWVHKLRDTRLQLLAAIAVALAALAMFLTRKRHPNQTG